MKWGKDAGMREPLAEVFALFGKTSVDDVVEGSEELSVASKERREWVADGLVRAIRGEYGSSQISGANATSNARSSNADSSRADLPPD
jgi:hypothetical protein